MIAMKDKRPPRPENAQAWASIGAFIAAQRTPEQKRAARWWFGPIRKWLRS